MRKHFSFVIPTYNGELSIGALLNKLVSSSSKYNTEIIVIDSGSRDKTINIVKGFGKVHSNIKLYEIKKKEFNHGTTRNLGVKLSKGKYICFFSQDVLPKSQHFLDYFIEDFKLNRRVVAVFGKQIPYKETPLVQKLDINFHFFQLDKFAKNGVLIQYTRYPFAPFDDKNKFVWYCLFDPFACYKKSYLSNNPFEETQYGEDILQGKKIIDSGLIKIYDSRAKAFHSHNFTLVEYYKRSKNDIVLWSQIVNPRNKFFFNNKFKAIFSLKESIFKKLYYALVLILHYILKVIIIVELNLFKK